MVNRIRRALGLTSLNLRIYAFLLASTWLVPSALLVRERYFDAKDYVSDHGIEGPFQAIGDGIRSDGYPRFAAGAKLELLQAGQTFAWKSYVCLEQGASMVGRADLVRSRDNETVVVGRSVFSAPDDHRCGIGIGSLQVPMDAEPGTYELRRIAILRPLSWFPLTRQLSSIRFPVAGATKPPR